MTAPYREAEPHPIVSDEVELRPIDWLAAKKSRLGTSTSVAMMALAVVAGVLLLPLVTELQFALLGGRAYGALTGLIAFIPPVALAFVASLAVGRLLLRVRSRAWLQRAEREFGVPQEQVRWVVDESAGRDG
jgi:hypothetical protein